MTARSPLPIPGQGRGFTVFRLCICDDHQEDLERLETVTQDLFRGHPDIPVCIQSFYSPYDLLEWLKEKGGFDLYLLDIIMPHMSGVELARKIRERGETAQILFLTSSREFAMDAFSVNAAGYLLKPVEKDAFCKAVLSAVQSLAPADDMHLLLKTREGLRRVRLRELVMVESFDHSRVCTLAGGAELETSATLTALMEQLEGDGRFFSPHRAYIVNLEYVNGLNAGELLLVNGQRVPVSRKIFPRLKEAYIRYAF